MTFDDKMKTVLVPQMANLLGTTVEELVFTLRKTYDLGSQYGKTNYLHNILLLKWIHVQPGHANMSAVYDVLSKHPEVMNIQTLEAGKDALLSELIALTDTSDLGRELYDQWHNINNAAVLQIANDVITATAPKSGLEFMRRLPELLELCETKLHEH